MLGTDTAAAERTEDLDMGGNDILDTGNLHVNGYIFTRRWGSTRIVDSPTKNGFDSIHDAIQDLPLGGDDLPQGHVHVKSGYDSSQEPTWPIELRGDLRVTGDQRVRTVVRPPANTYAFLIASDSNNHDSVHLSGFTITRRSNENLPDGGVKILGGIEHTLERLDMKLYTKNGIYISGDSNNAFSTTVRDCFMHINNGPYERGNHGVLSDASYQNNHLSFYNVRAIKPNESGFKFKGTDCAVDCYGCSVDKYHHYGVSCWGTRAFSWYGGYLEASSEGTNAFVLSDDASNYPSSAEIRGPYVNGAQYVVAAVGAESVGVSGITYTNLKKALVWANSPDDDVNLDLDSCATASEGTTSVHESDADPQPYLGDESAIRVDGTLVWQDLTRSDAPAGRYAGESAYHDGSGLNNAGLYVWDPNAGTSGASGAWVSSGGDTIDV